MESRNIRNPFPVRLVRSLSGYIYVCPPQGLEVEVNFVSTKQKAIAEPTFAGAHY